MNKGRFFCVGVQKSGTSSLHDLLESTGKFSLPKEKETHFFSNDELYGQGLEVYDSYFCTSSSNLIRGEVDPEYLYFENSCMRIFKYNAHAKIIVLVRNPVERAFSHYQMTKRRGIESLSFFQSLKIEQIRLKKGSYEKMHYSYLDRGYYYEQISKYISQFGRANVLVLDVAILDDLRNLEKELGQFLNSNIIFNGVSGVRSNSAKRAKSEMLSKALHYQVWLKNSYAISFVKLLCPDGTRRQNLVRKIRQSNFVSSENETPCSEAIEYITSRLKEDSQHLDVLLGSSFSDNWYSGNN